MANWDQIEGQWHQLLGNLKTKWGELTDDDLTAIAGRRDRLVGKLEERYGLFKEEAERQVDAWIDKLTPDERSTSQKQKQSNSRR